ncbi:MAG TPA: periplasmic heavy metal sensor [Verrucomicrobiae bacterium]|nr:periplasmic heavy metal sensor [Verrucomicrobiae bacterium]
MKRSAANLILALLAAGAVFAVSFVISQRVGAKRMASTADDLDWLRQEFRLSDAELARVRELHEGYLPKCAEMCKQIAAKKGELEAALTGVTNVNSDAEQKLAELASLRAQCQAQMLRHFVEVSQAMAPEQGRRYLAEMQRITLGFHEQIEQSMSPSADHNHGHH